MAVLTCLAQDGKFITDGEDCELTLQYGTADFHEEVKVFGTIRAFEQDGDLRWEIITNDPQWPAIGFLPENVKTRSGR